MPDVAVDCLSGAWPLYSAAQAVTGGVNTFSSSDSPSISVPRPRVKEFKDGSGRVLATVTWSTVASINCAVRDWTVVYIKSTGQIWPNAESNWSLDASTSDSGVQKAVGGSSHAVQNHRVVGTAATTTNEILKKNQRYSVTGTTSFTR